MPGITAFETQWLQSLLPTTTNSGTGENSMDLLSLPINSNPINASGLYSRLPDGRPNPQFYGIEWLVGTPDGTKVVANPFESGTSAWFQYEAKDKAGYLLLGGAALLLALVMGGRRR